MTELESKIIYLDRQYRMGNPLVSDKTFDELYDSLPKESALKGNGIIAEVDSDRKEKLPCLMASIDKVKTISELRDWLADLNLKPTDELIISGKYDGISLVAKEQTNQAWTRGDGIQGQQSKDHFLNMNYGFKDTNFDYTYGEAIMPCKLFQKHKGEFANARNMVSGLFGTSKIKLATQDVYFMRYGCSDDSISKQEQLDELNKSNPIPVEHLTVTYSELTKLADEDLIESFDVFYYQISDVFDIDGLIVEINDADKRKALGRESNGNPASARAIKLSQWQSGDTVDVLGVKWEVSKQGELKPVIQVVPTAIGGVTISNVTAYNARYVVNNNIGTGASIEIIRSGDVIPKHISTLVPSQDELPSVCPSCGSQVEWDTNKVELRCTDRGCCPETNIKKIAYFFKKAGFEYFAENNIRDLYCKEHCDILSILDVSSDVLASYDGWGKSSADRLLKQVNRLKSEGMSLAEQLQAFDMFEGTIGAKIAQKIFDTVEEFNWYNTEALCEIDGVSAITANAFIDGMRAFKASGFYGAIPVSFIKSPQQEAVGNTFEGYNICFSGVRDKGLEALIEMEGGSICSGVSKKTTHLIVKDLSEKTLSSSKAKKANSLGVKVTTIEEFKKV